ncbi:GSCOCG00000327001-RA-CDS [Cotesia congregata]|nr:GSCOCG00000327001-RA-CDS [Cotesia congregata]
MKMKRSKIDIINSTVESYLKRRGYQDIDIFNKSDHNKTITSEESLLREMAHAITNDVTAADQAYKKLRAWINLINDETVQEDLMNLLYPIFCHLYLEMLHAGNLQAAIEFFNSNRSDFITCKEKNFLDELSCVFSIQDAESKPIVNAFKIRKYRIINIHVTINIKIENMMEEEEENDSGSKFGDININGHMEQNAGTGTDREMRELLEVIRGLNNNPYKPLKIFRIGNSIEKGSCATIPNKMDKFAVGFNENTIRLWPMGSTRLMRPLIFAGHYMDINSIKFHPNGNYLATGSADKSVKLWSKENGEALRSYPGVQSTIYCLAFSPDGKYLAAAGDDKTVLIWDLATDGLLNELKGHEGTIMNLDWSPDGQFIVSGDMNGTVRLWSAKIATNNGISIPMQSTSEIDIPAVQVLQSNGKAILTLRFNPRNNSPMCVVTA